MLRRAPLILLALVVAHGAQAGPRVAWHADSAPSDALLAALDALAVACERGDRAALVRLLPPDSRADAGNIVETILSTPARPLTDVRIEVVALNPGAALLFAKVPVAKDDEALPAPRDGFARGPAGTAVAALGFDPRPGSGGAVLLALASAMPAGVAECRLEVALDDPGGKAAWTARSRSRLVLDRALHVALLGLPNGATVRSTDASVRLQPVERQLGDDGGAVRVEWTGGAATTLEIECDATLPKALAHDGAAALLHQQLVVPFSTTGHFRFEARLDVPAPLSSLCVGTPESVQGAPGRKVTRWTCDRPVDYLPIAAAQYSIDSVGEGADRLELWRTRDVGGPAGPILEELRELVAFQEEKTGPLPYRAFRLVELPTLEGLAVSYASVIFMTPGLLAVREKRAEILSHEVAHQWWGNAVSPDPTARWASEGMADALKDLFVLRRFGRDAYLDRLDDHASHLLTGLGASSRPLGTFPGGGDAYDRGALFVHALRADLGDDVFDRVLRGWYERLQGSRPTTRDFRREAEAIAGRSLAGVFDPWLGTTSLPVLDLDWSAAKGASGATLHARVTQWEPHFALPVVLRATAEGGETHDVEVAVAGASTAVDVEIPFVPKSVALDPDRLLALVRAENRDAYLASEGAARLARGDAKGARAILEARPEGHLLPRQSYLHLFAARVLDGMPVQEARRELDVVLATAADAPARQRLALAAVDELLVHGAAAPALPLLGELDREIDDGSAIPRRLGLALRLLGREDEAQVALRRAVERRPDDEAARGALGLAGPSSASGSASTSWIPRVPDDSPLLQSASADATFALALSGGRAVVVVGDARALLSGRDALAAATGFAPVAVKGLAAVDAGSREPIVGVLESFRLKSRLTIFAIAEDGRARKLAVHERLPADARALIADGSTFLLAFLAKAPAPADEAVAAAKSMEWWRVTVPLDGSTEGPDDDDGLKRLKPHDDARLALAGATGGTMALVVDGFGLVGLDEDGLRLVGDGGTAWEPLGAASSTEGAAAIRSARRHGAGMALMLRHDASRSPFAEDAAGSLRLTIVLPDGVVSRDLPDGTSAASVAPDGGVLLVALSKDDDLRLLGGSLR